MANGYLHFADYNTSVYWGNAFGVTLPGYALDNPNPILSSIKDYNFKPILIDFFSKTVKCIDFNNPDIEGISFPGLPGIYHFSNIEGTNAYISDNIPYDNDIINILFAPTEHGLGISFLLNFPNT